MILALVQHRQSDMAMHLLHADFKFWAFLSSLTVRYALGTFEFLGGLYVVGWLWRYAHPRGSADKFSAILQLKVYF